MDGALVDLDEDGSDELIIGCLADEDRADPDSPIGRAGYQLLDIYTLDGDNAELIIDAWGRNSWFITNDNKLVIYNVHLSAYTTDPSTAVNQIILLRIYVIFVQDIIIITDIIHIIWIKYLI